MILELKNIYKNYMQGKLELPVLKDISLQVEWRRRIMFSTSAPSYPTCLN